MGNNKRTITPPGERLTWVTLLEAVMNYGCRLNAACHEPEYANLPPSQIVPILLDKESYHASESSYYPVLKQASQLHYCGRSHAPKNVGKPTVVHKANELWSWDITYLVSFLRDSFTICICLKIFLAARLLAMKSMNRSVK
ncbi:MAG: hypothetical protein ACI96W_002993 [Paraglaciecola sp.]|jgi:hypothetical protein